MSKKEKLILYHIKQNPYISQIELAQILNLSRSAVAGYISSLMKQGKIIGKAYIVEEESRIICIGGATIDRKAFPIKPIEFGTTNLVSFNRSPGGVARNIAETLGRLDCVTSLITAVGDDDQGRWLLDYTQRHQVDVSQSFTLNGNTGSHTSILNTNGEVILGLDDMQICDNVNFSMIDKRWSHIGSAHIILLDLNFPQEVTTEIIRRCYLEDRFLCVTPISTTRVEKLPNDLQGINLLIVNKLEAEALTSIIINEVKEDCKKVCQAIQEKGVKKVVINLGRQGLFFSTAQNNYKHLSVEKRRYKDKTGERDALIAGVLYGLIQGSTLEEACKMGLALSTLTIQTQYTVNPNLTAKDIEEFVEKEFSN